MIFKRFKKPNNAPEIIGEARTPCFPDDELIIKCPFCNKNVFTAEICANLYVCPRCGEYHKMPARSRISLLADEGSFVEMFSDIRSKNILNFPEYDQKLLKAEKLSGEPEAVICGSCSIDGLPIALFIMDASFMMGSMGAAVGEKITLMFEFATQHNLPVIGYTVSGGARMQEGIVSLMQMAKTSAAVTRHGKAGGLYITVVTDPTTGGVTASFAMLGDIILAEPKALIGFAGPRVIEQTIRQKLPPLFQRSEFLLEKGFVDSIVERKDQRVFISKILRLSK